MDEEWARVTHSETTTTSKTLTTTTTTPPPSTKTCQSGTIGNWKIDCQKNKPERCSLHTFWHTVTLTNKNTRLTAPRRVFVCGSGLPDPCAVTFVDELDLLARIKTPLPVPFSWVVACLLLFLFRSAWRARICKVLRVLHAWPAAVPRTTHCSVHFRR